MKWKVKKRFRQHILFRESYEIVAFVCRLKGEYIILNQKKQQVYSVIEITPVSMKIQGMEEGTAVITLSKQHSLFHPPMANQLLLSWNNASIMIEQSKKRDYTILRGQDVIGTIMGILGTTVNISVEESMSAEIVALMYALSLRMLHEDDIEIV